MLDVLVSLMLENRTEARISLLHLMQADQLGVRYLICVGAVSRFEESRYADRYEN